MCEEGVNSVELLGGNGLNIFAYSSPIFIHFITFEIQLQIHKCNLTFMKCIDNAKRAIS